MRLHFYIYLLSLLLLTQGLFSQTQTYRENLKWGIKENGNKLIAPIYDTIFNFDSTSRVCLGCFKVRKAAASKFIKTISISYSCNYLNKKAERLIIREEYGDTVSTFSMGKTTVNQYQQNKASFIVSAKSKKHLVDKNFKQLTFKGYHDIELCNEKSFYIAQIINEADVLVTGLVNYMEREIVPFNYSTIKVNTTDSLIIACSAGIRTNGEDFVFDYDGKKKEATHRHIDIATKHFLIHKIFEPHEYYIFYNLETKKETTFIADEVKLHMHDEILVRIKKDWYLYDLITNQKKVFKQS